MGEINSYKVSSADWRLSLQKNQRNTIIVIFLFLLIYTMVGFIIDVYWYDTTQQSLNYYNYYTQSYNPPSNQSTLSIKDIIINLITFQILPQATGILMIIAIFSLWITYAFHKGLVMLGTEYHEVTADTPNAFEENQLYNVVEEMKIASGLGFMPKIYIIEADYMNAFASGYSEKSALIAITRGLLKKLDRNELEAVIAHELSHIRHNDIRLMLTAVVLSNLSLIAFDLLFRSVIYGRRNRDNNGLVFIIIIIRFLLPIITLLLMFYLSRTREFMADAGSVELMRNNEPLASALLKIHTDHTTNEEAYQQAYSNTSHEEVRRPSYLYDPNYAGIKMVGSINNLFSTHPSLEERLKAIGVEKNKERDSLK